MNSNAFEKRKIVVKEKMKTILKSGTNPTSEQVEHWKTYLGAGNNLSDIELYDLIDDLQMKVEEE